MLFSHGQAECFEYTILASRNCALDIAKEVIANILMMNYPGVMHSQGQISMRSLAKVHSACVTYLRDHLQKLRAKQIIAYGYSLGIGMRAAFLESKITDGSDGDGFLIKDHARRSLSAIAML
ncbi:hypothetical protein BOKEGFJH_00012 [Chlamydia avium]|uniref:Alpha/beta hydrolase family protein n=2 Tax=Chlamydia avium TaxID=1457141 RepID=W8JFD1_9CHLA|nr:Uncharacterized protein M832_00110 [Chlamydia avium 10DC88]EPP37742.1 hypothetical protein CP10743SC13_0329 [Chlamydia psittaci 10_743_SC13]EPP38821.1 hypothetical protein CP10881SC42_0415 [Chlamydia avium]VVT42505.1 hypothetical protein BOKEGFJH_00012 [Chlamydia avium]